MKRKFANRPGWKRILQKRYYQTYLKTAEFTGHVALLCLDAVRAPLVVKVYDKPVCIVDSGYSWLQYFPDNAHYIVTTVFDANSQPVCWYIDVCLSTGVDDDNISWMDDLYLDIAILPSGEVELLDADELEDAYGSGAITEEAYNLALRVARELLDQIANHEFSLLASGTVHRNLLLSSGPVAREVAEGPWNKKSGCG